MTEYATGGIVRVDNTDDAVVLYDLGYAIPPKFAREWAKSILDRINEGLDKPDEDGVE